jgi:hypothetical protein
MSVRTVLTPGSFHRPRIESASIQSVTHPFARHRHGDFPFRHTQSRLPRRGTTRLSTLTTDGRHVIPIAGHRDATLPTRRPSLVRRPLVRRSLFVRRTPTLAGDLTLTRGIH